MWPFKKQKQEILHSIPCNTQMPKPGDKVMTIPEITRILSRPLPPLGLKINRKESSAIEFEQYDEDGSGFTIECELLNDGIKTLCITQRIHDTYVGSMLVVNSNNNIREFLGLIRYVSYIIGEELKERENNATADISGGDR